MDFAWPPKAKDSRNSGIDLTDFSDSTAGEKYTHGKPVSPRAAALI